METKSKRGGFRAGSGRTRIYKERLVKKTIRISIDHTLTLSKIDLNLSKAVRAMMDDPVLSQQIRDFIERKKETTNDSE